MFCLALFSHSSQLVAQSTATFACGSNLTQAQQQIYVDYVNTHPQVSGGLLNEYQVPLHVYYVHADDGKPAYMGFSLNEFVGTANTMYDGLMEFYICKYEQINKTEYTEFNTATYSGLGYLGSSGNSGYMDKVDLDMDAASAANPSTWSFRAIKVGDVNCNFTPDNISNPGSNFENIGIAYETGPCVNVGEFVTVTIKATWQQAMAAYQLGFKYDKTALKLMEKSAGELSDFSVSNFGVDAPKGQLRTLWFPQNGLSLGVNTTAKSLFTLKFKALKSFCSLGTLLQLDERVLPSYFYGRDGKAIKTDVGVNYVKILPRIQVNTVFPNPASSSVAFKLELLEAQTVNLQLLDAKGNTLYFESRFPAGSSVWNIDDLKGLLNGAITFIISVDGNRETGTFIKEKE